MTEQYTQFPADNLCPNPDQLIAFFQQFINNATLQSMIVPAFYPEANSKEFIKLLEITTNLTVTSSATPGFDAWFKTYEEAAKYANTHGMSKSGFSKFYAQKQNIQPSDTNIPQPMTPHDLAHLADLDAIYNLVGCWHWSAWPKRLDPNFSNPRLTFKENLQHLIRDYGIEIAKSAFIISGMDYLRNHTLIHDIDYLYVNKTYSSVIGFNVTFSANEFVTAFETIMALDQYDDFLKVDNAEKIDVCVLRTKLYDGPLLLVDALVQRFGFITNTNRLPTASKVAHLPDLSSDRNYDGPKPFDLDME